MVALFNTKKVQRAVPFTLPAPVKGLNGRDGLASMDPMNAFVMTNHFPGSTTVDTRNGSVNFVTGVGGPVESLETYVGGALVKMLAFGNGSVYEISGGVLGAAIASGKTSNKISSAMFSNAGNQYLIGLTGADAPFSYEGTTYTALAITGLTGSQNTLHGVLAFKGRLFFAQANQLGFYYLAVGAIQGVASYFDLAQVAKKGGTLAGIASFSMDSGNGPADYIVFLTTEGEYLLYSGTDPSSAVSWALVGRYYAAPPIGRKGWFNFRSDLYVITEAGLLSFRAIRNHGDTNEQQDYLTGVLGRIYTDLSTYSTVHGWTSNIYSRNRMLVVNVPKGTSPAAGYVQFVMNTDTGAWCKFSEWDGLSWTVFNKRLYYGTYDGRIVLADEGSTDNGAQINCETRQAYNYFDDGRGMGSSDKQFHYMIFIMQADGTPPISAQLTVNFLEDAPAYVGSLAPSTGPAWDVATWDVDGWGGDAATQNFTVGVGKVGFVGSVWMRTVATGTPLKWFATRVICEKCAGLVLI